MPPIGNPQHPSCVQAGMNTLQFKRWVLAGALATAASPSGCINEKAPQQASQANHASLSTAPPSTLPAANSSAAAESTPIYDTVNQVLTLPPCKATIKHQDNYSARFTTADGKTFVIGSDRAEQEIWHFIAHLPEGQTCELPGALVAFENRKFYPSADEIKAMPPCRAAVAVAGPCFSVFNATDGKVFVIGDPGSKLIVYHFLRSLEKGRTYALPDAFVEYQKGHAKQEEED
jgi:hypothetical protein